jgi:hypothetical protein
VYKKVEIKFENGDIMQKGGEGKGRVEFGII